MQFDVTRTSVLEILQTLISARECVAVKPQKAIRGGLKKGIECCPSGAEIAGQS